MTDLPTQKLYERACEAVRAASFPDDVIEQCLYEYTCAAAGLACPDSSFDEALGYLCHYLYTDENLTYVPAPPLSGGMDEARYRDQLLLIMRRSLGSVATVQIFCRVVANMGVNALRHIQSHSNELPRFGTHNVPLLDLFPKPLDALFDTYLCVFDELASNLHLFEKLRRQILANQDTLAALYPQFKKLAVIRPTHINLPPRESLNAFLRDTRLHTFFLAPIRVHRPDFVLPDQTRFSGHWIVAPPGRGKSVLLSGMFLEDIKSNASVIVMDSKGDLIGPIKRLRVIKDRLVLIEPSAETPLALNPLDIPKTNVAHTISLLEYVMSSLLEARMTPLQTALFRKLIPAFLESTTTPTLDSFRKSLIDGIAANALTTPDFKDFFTDRERGFHSKTYAETRNQLVWRLDFLLSNPVLKAMFASLKTKLDLGKEMDAGKVILIDNSKSVLSDEGAEFFGRFFIALILAAAQQRAGRKSDNKLPCYVYIDECQSVIARDQKIATILDECRSQKIGLILAHQRTAQLTPPVLDAVSNCAIRMANSDDEAKTLSEKLRLPVDTLRSLPVGTFAAFVRDLTTAQGITVSFPNIDLATLPQLTPAEQDEIRKRMETLYGAVQTAPVPPVAPPPTAQPPSGTELTDPDAGPHTNPSPNW